MQHDDGNISSAPIEAIISSVTALELPSISGGVQNVTAEDNLENAQQSQRILEELQADLKKIFSDCESIFSSTRIDRSLLLSISYAIESFQSKKDEFESLDYSSATQESESKSKSNNSEQPESSSSSSLPTEAHQPSSNNHYPPSSSQHNSLVFSEKQVVRLLLLTGTDHSRLSKSYICAHVWSDLFEARIVDMSCIESTRVLINLINMFANLLQLLPGISVCSRVSTIIHESVDYLLTQGDLGPAYNEFLEKLKSNPLVSESRVTKSLENHSKRIEGFAASDDINEKIQAVNLIFDLLSDCMSFEQQINFFAVTITPTLKDLVHIPITLTNAANTTDPNVKDLLILLSKLVLALLVNPTLEIDINPQDIRRFYSDTKWFEYAKLAKDTPTRAESAPHTQENKQPQQTTTTTATTATAATAATTTTKRTTVGNIVKYEINGIKEIMSRSQKIYSNTALIVNALLLFPADNELMRFCLQILISLFKIFFEFRENLRVPLLTVLQNIAELTQNTNNNSSKGDAQEHAAIFLYELMQKEEFASAPSAQPLIAAIKKNAEIVQALITTSPFYSDRYITPTPQNKSILKLEDLIIHKTFAIQERIEAEKGHSFYIEVNTSWSIIYVGFATHSNDIKVHLNKVEDITDSSDPSSSSNSSSSKQLTATPYRILSERVNCEQDPYHIVALVENPGIYSVTFDNSYSWFNSKQLRYRNLTLSPLNTQADTLQHHILYSPLHFDCLNLNLFKKFDANWCELHVLSHSLEIDVTTADKQNLRDVITSHDLARANDAILKRFPTFSKADYFSILVIYESQAWTEILVLYAQKLIAERVLSRTEVDQRRLSRDFQLTLFQRLLQEKFAFLTQFKTLSIEAVEDISYFWFKQAPFILAQQQPQSVGATTTETNKLEEVQKEKQESSNISVPAAANTASNSSQLQSSSAEQVVLIVKCNPVTKIFAMKLFSQGQLHGVKLDDLDEELFSLCEVLLSEKNPEKYFAGFCEFTKAFLLAHESHGITKLVLFLDPSNLFWNQSRLKQLESFLHTQLTNLPKIPQLIMSSI